MRAATRGPGFTPRLHARLRCRPIAHSSSLPEVPANWKVLMIVIAVFLCASVVIGTYRLVTTPVELFGANFEGLQQSEFPGRTGR